ncbi:hypothetical protein ACFLX5_04115 [Chloroflexota bacterium]
MKYIWGLIFKKRPASSDVETIQKMHPEITPERMKALACLENGPNGDPVLEQIASELENHASVLELMKAYMAQLEGEADNNAPAFGKLARLFESGTVPDRVEGHHYGVTLGLRTGEGSDIGSEYSNFLNFLWGRSLDEVSPWVGKGLTLAGASEVQSVTGRSGDSAAPVFRGINYFNQMEESPLNKLSVGLLTFWMNLKETSSNEAKHHGYERVGGNFLAARTMSVHPDTKREVFQLNYRWEKLGNLPPLNYLIDEMVRIGDGLYLGQLLFATKHLLESYKPDRASADYAYRNFGYFLMMDERWRSEARRLFPQIDIPKAARAKPEALPEKFTNFTFAQPADAPCDDSLMAEVHADMSGRETIIDLLKQYSDELKDDHSTESPVFTKLNELFNRGVAPREIRGFYRGALVSFQSEGLLGTFDLNTLNMAWGLARLFTPWTGKAFEDISPQKLAEFTEGHETSKIPSFWGVNTYSARTTRKKIACEAMKIGGIWTEDPTDEEKRSSGIDLKGFFFIGNQALSVNRDNSGKTVFRINYRWPKLKTFPPDCYCYDEIVQIAEGLYLGQLMYATDVFRSYDPDEDDAKYKYRNFGYFLLMDEGWHRRRLKIGFDLDNV